MKIIIKNTIEFLVNSNFWIAIATVSFYELTLLQLHKPVVIDATVCFLFFSTLFIYNLFRVLNLQNEFKTWYAQNFSYTKFLILFAFVGTGASFYFFDKQYILFVIIAGVLSFLYASPFVGIGNKVFHLRKFWFLKSSIIALVWVCLTVLLPVVQNDFDFIEYRWLILEKFLFILGITIPYDIKDIQEDKSNNVRTIALKFGVQKTLWISRFILLIAFTISSFVTIEGLLPNTVVYFTTIVLISKLDEKKSDLWYTFFIDGTIILYFLSVWIYS